MPQANVPKVEVVKQMQNYVSKYVVCPFYSQESHIRIHCEGIEKDNRLQLCFECIAGKQKHKRKYCDSLDNYTNCPLYKAINIQYEEDKR